MSKYNIKEQYDDIVEGYVKRLVGIDTDYISIGFFNHKYSFMIRGNIKRNTFESTKLVTISKSVIFNGETQLIFSLQDNEYLELFIKLIEDIYETLLKDPGDAIGKSYYRWLLWKKMFSATRYDLLSESKIMGLVGELIFLNMLKNKYDESLALLSWGGADFNKKDFEFNKQWCEIKTTTNDNEIKISSLEQLQSINNGYLVLYIIEKTTAENYCAYNLNSLVRNIIDSIEMPENKEIFINKLSSQGYMYNEEYDSFNYLLLDTNFYLVNNNFPLLSKENVPFGVIKAKYILDANCLLEFKVGEEDIFIDGTYSKRSS